jgi:hypothetical protein
MSGCFHGGGNTKSQIAYFWGEHVVASSLNKGRFSRVGRTPNEDHVLTAARVLWPRHDCKCLPRQFVQSIPRQCWRKGKFPSYTWTPRGGYHSQRSGSKIHFVQHTINRVHRGCRVSRSGDTHKKRARPLHDLVSPPAVGGLAALNLRWVHAACGQFYVPQRACPAVDGSLGVEKQARH